MSGMRPDDLYELRWVGDPRLSPDGSTVAYVVWGVDREANDYREKVVLAKIAKVKFHGEALAGDEVTFEARLLFLREEGAAIDGKVFANGHELGEAELTFAHMDSSKMPPELGGKNFVFTGRLKNLMDSIAKLQAAH